MYGYVGLCMAMYDYVGLCMAVYAYVAYVGLCRIMYTDYTASTNGESLYDAYTTYLPYYVPQYGAQSNCFATRVLQSCEVSQDSKR